MVDGILLPEDVLRVRRRCALPGLVPIRVLGRDTGDGVGHRIEVRWGSENGVRPLFVSFPAFLPCMGRKGVHVLVDEVVLAL